MGDVGKDAEEEICAGGVASDYDILWLAIQVVDEMAQELHALS